MVRPPEPGEIRRKLRWIAVWPFGLIGGLVGPVLMSPLLRARNSAHCDCSCDVAVPAWELIAYGVVTAAMTMAAIALALRKESATDTRAVTLLAVFGWLNCPACLVVWTLVTEHDAGLESLGISLFVATFFGTLIGIFVALPLGFLYALAFAPTLRAIRRLRQSPPLDALPRSVRSVAFTVVVVALLATFAAKALDDSLHASMPAWLYLTSVGPALVALVWAELSIRGTRAWLRRVARGHEPSWRFVSMTGAALPDLASIPHDPRLPEPALLVFTPESSATYRTTAERIVWARSGNGSGDGSV